MKSASEKRYSGRPAAGRARRPIELRGGLRRRVAAIAWIVLPDVMDRRLRRKSGPQYTSKESYRLSDPVRLAAEAERLTYRPLISVLMLAHNAAPQCIHRMVASVLAQAYPEWELVICAGANSRKRTLKAAHQSASLDKRIRVTRFHDLRGYRSAVRAGAVDARGEFVCVLDHHDELLPAALLEVVKTLNRDRRLDILYTDQDYLEADGSVAQRLHKTDWSRDMPCATMQFGHLLVVRHSLAKSTGYLTPTLDETSYLEVIARLTEKTERIAHIPKILYGRRKLPGRAMPGTSGTCDVEKPQDTSSEGPNGSEAADRDEESLSAVWSRPGRLQQWAKLIAFYLPQFHPIPENDRWWGEGFTEWTNVKRATPNFVSHYQPQIPTDLGYYDLRDPEVMRKQVALAKAHGINGFCFYYYWFNGHRLLGEPLDHFLCSGTPDFPFCLCWANENWTRRWDGSESEILIEQRYESDYAEELMHDLLPFLRDRRYIRVDGAPLLLIYRADLLPAPAEAARRWREMCASMGLPKIHLAAVQSFGITDPRPYGFDAAVEFPPHSQHSVPAPKNAYRNMKNGFRGLLDNYEELATIMSEQPAPPFLHYRGVMPGWDNTPRRMNRARIYLNSSPKAYGDWLARAVEWTMARAAVQEPLVFLNAWNEWGEGAYLEPDSLLGHARLEATRRGLCRGMADFLASCGSQVTEPMVEAALVDQGALTQREQDSPQNGATSLPKVSVVIPNWNGMLHLPECLGALARQSLEDFEIIMVDNASSDESVEWVASNYSRVQIIRRDDNGGFSKAVNVGIRAAQGEYIALLNNDTVPGSGWLLALVDALERRPEYDIAASKMILFSKPGRLNSAGDVYALARLSGRNRGLGAPEAGYQKTERVLGACAGAALYRRTLFDQVGLFDEDFFLMSEDTDFNLRCLIAGKRCLYVPGASIRHKVRGSIDTRPAWEMIRLSTRNEALVVAKDMPAVVLILVPFLLPYRFLRHTFPVRPSKWHLIPLLVRQAPGRLRAELEGFRLGLAKRAEVWSHKAIGTPEILRWLLRGSGPA